MWRDDYHQFDTVDSPSPDYPTRYLQRLQTWFAELEVYAVLVYTPRCLELFPRSTDRSPRSVLSELTLESFVEGDMLLTFQ